MSGNKKIDHTKTPRKKIFKFEKFNPDPYALPLIKNRVLSPTTRARRILGRTPKLDKIKKIDVDSSLEKSLEKIENDLDDQFNTKTKADKPVYSK